MNDIDRIMYLFDWNRSQNEQEEGLAMAREVTCIKAFFQPIGPGYSKNVWDNCALAIKERSDDELRPYILDMLLWIEDLNWPGAETIQQRLCSFQDVGTLVRRLNGIVPVLAFLKKDSWLLFIAELLKNKGVREQLSTEALEVLSKILVAYKAAINS